MAVAGRRLTFVVPRGVPEGLVEFGQVEDHQQLVRFSLHSHLLSPDHRLDAERSLGHVERQLVVSGHVLLVEGIEIAAEGQRGKEGLLTGTLRQPLGGSLGKIDL